MLEEVVKLPLLLVWHGPKYNILWTPAHDPTDASTLYSRS